MRFLITAYDGKDEGALERRMAARPAHMANIDRVKEIGSVVCAGYIKDEGGSPAGSFLVLDFESREMLDDYLASEPYATENVWQEINVEAVNVVIMNDERIGQ